MLKLGTKRKGLSHLFALARLDPMPPRPRRINLSCAAEPEPTNLGSGAQTIYSVRDVKRQSEFFPKEDQP
jgi:hypothetical protein